MNELGLGKAKFQFFRKITNSSKDAKCSFKKRSFPKVEILFFLILFFRLETLDDLDSIEELRDAAELKNKLLFSVVVVSPGKKNYLKGH